MSDSLANFEDSDDDLTPPPFNLPSRRRAEPAATEPEPGPAPADEPAAGDRGVKAPSNIHIPIRLVEALTKARAQEQQSNGDLFIRALEEHYEQLQTAFHRPATAGGKLFAARTTKAPRQRNTEPVSPVNYRMSEQDYQTLDTLVSELGAASRSHLISQALELWLTANHYRP